jgi:ribosomal protein L29
MKASEIQKKTDTDLEKLIAETREEVRTLRFNSAGSGLRDRKAIHNAKRTIARALTERTARSKSGDKS